MLLVTVFSASWIILNIEARHFLFRKLDSFVPFKFKRKSRRIENRDADAPESNAEAAISEAEAARAEAEAALAEA